MPLCIVSRIHIHITAGDAENWFENCNYFIIYRWLFRLSRWVIKMNKINYEGIIIIVIILM